MSTPRIMIAAPKSGSGKTLITCGILQTLVNAQKKTAAFKCGPDYIDPMFHKSVIGIPSKNLDSFFTGEKTTRELFLDGAEGQDISVIEGVMGLYDGLGGIKVEASSYDIACITKTPIILVVDANGMGGSVIPLLAGFCQYDTEHLIKGVILNKTSEMFLKVLKSEIEEKTGLKVLGSFPKQEKGLLESRHLGLVMPEEIPEIKDRIQELSILCKKYIDMDQLLQIAGNAENLSRNPISIPVLPEKKKLAVAMDESACFYYEDNLRLLEKMGMEIVPFSLMEDKKIPKDVDGLLLGGGYPELHLEELSNNSSMKNSIKQAIEDGIPSVAECGGFLYLHDEMEDTEGKTYSMAGVISGKGFYTGKLVRFGYITLECQVMSEQIQTSVMISENKLAKSAVRGHEFHYYDSTNNGTDFKAKKPVTARTWECMHASKNHMWGFPHLYYYSNPNFIYEFWKGAFED